MSGLIHDCEPGFAGFLKLYKFVNIAPAANGVISVKLFQSFDFPAFFGFGRARA